MKKIKIYIAAAALFFAAFCGVQTFESRGVGSFAENTGGVSEADSAAENIKVSGADSTDENIKVSGADGTDGNIKVSGADGADGDVKLAALTFDDGPKRGTTDVLLEELRARDVRATFFLIGMQIKENKAIVDQMYEDGHQIGNHTFEHVNLADYPEDGQQCQLLLCSETLSWITGRNPDFIRPPFGEISDSLKSMVNAPIILWSVDTNDWTGKSRDEIADYIVKNIRPGDIVLMHDIYEESVYGALMAVDRLKSQGYEFVTVGELFEAYDIPLEAGKVYRKTY